MQVDPLVRDRDVRLAGAGDEGFDLVHLRGRLGAAPREAVHLVDGLQEPLERRRAGVARLLPLRQLFGVLVVRVAHGEEDAELFRKIFSSRSTLSHANARESRKRA